MSHPLDMLGPNREGHRHADFQGHPRRARGRAHDRLRPLRAAGSGPATTASSPSFSGGNPMTPWSSTPTRRGRCACSSRPGSCRHCASTRGRADRRPAPPRPHGSGEGRVKRHLLVTNDFPPKVGGIQNYLWELWSRLDPASYVVLTASSDAGAAAFDAAQAARGVRIERVPGTTLFFPTTAALAAVRTLRGGQRHRLGPARPRAPARAPRPSPRRALRCILHGAEVTVPGRIPGSAPHSPGCCSAPASSWRRAATRRRRAAGPPAPAWARRS